MRRQTPNEFRALVLNLLLTLAPAAEAYLDPSTGSLILSAIVGLLATIGSRSPGSTGSSRCFAAIPRPRNGIPPSHRGIELPPRMEGVPGIPRAAARGTPDRLLLKRVVHGSSNRMIVRF
jgi:hypothetical protein